MSSVAPYRETINLGIMSEDGEMWAAVHEENKQKKLQNEKQSIAILRKRGIEFKMLSESSAHYRVGDFDFWPTTGKFYNQKTGERGRGVFTLLKKIKP